MRKNRRKSSSVRVETFQAEGQRTRILEAAKEQLIQGGLEAVVLRTVAQSLSMHHSNVQYYFRTRHDLLVAIFDQEARKYTEDVRVAVSAAQRGQARAAALIDTIIDLMRGPDTALWRLIIGTLDHNPELAAVHKRQIREHADVLMVELSEIFPSLPLPRRRRLVTVIQTVIGGLAVQFAHAAPGSAESRRIESHIREALHELIAVECQRSV
jgi:AcrR family transcriptional regulator